MICETGENRQQEQEVADYVGSVWGVSLLRFPDTARVDRAVTRNGRILALAEIKNRDHASNQFPTLWLKVSKRASMMILRESQKVPVLYIARFADGRTAAIEVETVSKFPIGPIGRNIPRVGVANEREVAHLIPLDALHWVGEDTPPDFGEPEMGYADPFSHRAEGIAKRAILRADTLGLQNYGPAPPPVEDPRDFYKEAIEEVQDAAYYMLRQVARLEDLKARCVRNTPRRNAPRREPATATIQFKLL